MTRLRITIDELVLDGAAHVDQAQLIVALQQALAQQVAARGLPAAAHVPQVQIAMPEFTAASLAGEIARTIYGDQS